MDEHIIDISSYLTRDQDPETEATFAVWGGDEDRARFALPVWRAIFLLGGNWGGVISLPKNDHQRCPRPFFTLDLARDPARVPTPSEAVESLREARVPEVARSAEGDVAVLLGEDSLHQWFLLIREGDPEAVLDGRRRESLLFMAGECAGLLLLEED